MAALYSAEPSCQIGIRVPLEVKKLVSSWLILGMPKVPQFFFMLSSQRFLVCFLVVVVFLFTVSSAFLQAVLYPPSLSLSLSLLKSKGSMGEPEKEFGQTCQQMVPLWRNRA